MKTLNRIFYHVAVFLSRVSAFFSQQKYLYSHSAPFFLGL